MTPFEQGYAAFLRGLQVDDCPFDKDGAPYSLKRWVCGWRKAHAARQEKHP